MVSNLNVSIHSLYLVIVSSIISRLRRTWNFETNRLVRCCMCMFVYPFDRVFVWVVTVWVVTVCPCHRMMVFCMMEYRFVRVPVWWCYCSIVYPYDRVLFYSVLYDGITVCSCTLMIVLPYDGVTVRWNAVRWYSSILDIVWWCYRMIVLCSTVFCMMEYRFVRVPVW